MEKQNNVQANNPETIDLFVFAGAATNSIYKFADGTSLTEILSEALAVFPKGSKAFEGWKEIGTEAANAGIPEKTARVAAYSGQLGSEVPELDRADLTAGVNGLFSIYEMGRRKGRDQGAAEALKLLEAGQSVSEVRSALNLKKQG